LRWRTNLKRDTISGHHKTIRANQRQSPVEIADEPIALERHVERQRRAVRCRLAQVVLAIRLEEGAAERRAAAGRIDDKGRARDCALLRSEQCAGHDDGDGLWRPRVVQQGCGESDSEGVLIEHGHHVALAR
jgi:hypothetical protein